MKYLILCLTSVPLQLIGLRNCFKLNRSLITLIFLNNKRHVITTLKNLGINGFEADLPKYLLRLNKKKLFIFLPEELGNQLKSGEDGINRTIH